MTYAGMKSYIYANLEKDDPRVRAAYDWIRSNWSLDGHVGLKDPNQGRFYYYQMMSKGLLVYGEAELVEKENGKTHRNTE